MVAGKQVFMRTMLLLIAILLAAIPMPAEPPSTKPAHAPGVAERRQQLLALLDEEWQYELLHRPEFATALGDKRYNDRFSDESPQAQQVDIDRRRTFLAKFEAVDAVDLSIQDSLSRSLMIRNLRGKIEGAHFKCWEMPVNQFGGPQTDLVDLVSLTPFDDVHDYENYVSRLRNVPGAFEQITSNMRLGIRDRLVPPRYLLEKAAAQAQGIANTAAHSSPFRRPLDKFPSTVSVGD